MSTCAYGCGKNFDHVDDLRPYGFDSAMVCFECAMAAPERAAEAQRRLLAHAATIPAGQGLVVGGGLPCAYGERSFEQGAVRMAVPDFVIQDGSEVPQ